MKIWTVTPNDDSGAPAPTVHYTADAANAAAREWVESYWPAWMDADFPIPDDWKAALELLTNLTGFMDSISVAEHDISDHPDLGADLADAAAYERHMQETEC